MNFNRPYTFELARQFLIAQHEDPAAQHLDVVVLTEEDHAAIAGHYANAERNGVDRATLDRAAHTLLRLAPADVDEWIRQEYIVDGWLHGYLALTADPADPSLTTWQLGQLAYAHYLNAS
ncbi:hypothetical protein [Mycolicibacterium frederiksbergense]|uniref:Uncharacterized protein n=1 Tax=Mycolicibacterium frederiksbergense TaxID=117567 RepID=A0A6H0RY82_9MYCO|nr:hypothetical protein [Mycolicibacterium frederiksbergense]QIV79894.1 hypothetical protein EXE63_02495 [Mycolicibacterium frederiksbergense]